MSKQLVVDDSSAGGHDAWSESEIEAAFILN
jgi:hypothetical protein